MRYKCPIQLLVMFALLCSCGEDTPPSGQVCEAFQSEAACYDAGCAIFDGAYFGSILKNGGARRCQWDAEPRHACLQADVREQESVLSSWGRLLEDGTTQRMVLFHNYDTDEIEGWLRCASPLEAGDQPPGTLDCSCEQGEVEPPL